MKIRGYFLIVLISTTSFYKCSFNDAESPEPALYSSDVFGSDAEGWEAGFAEYNVDYQDSIQSEFSHGAFIPGGTLQDVSAIIQSGKAVDGDLFMFIKKKIGGLEPGTFYEIGFNIEFYVQLNEEYPEEIFDDEHGTFLKAGAYAEEPLVDTLENFDNSGTDRIVTKFDHGEGKGVGEQMVYLGKVTHTQFEDSPIVMNGVSYTNPIIAETNSEGNIWLMIGLDTNVPIYQSAYFSFIVVQFQKLSQ